MNYSIFFFIFLIFISCGEEKVVNEPPIEKTPISNELEANTNPLKEINPPGLSPDKSWIVSMDIQEGFLLSYTITYQSGEEVVSPIDESYAIIGGVDFTSTKWIDNETYYVPHIGGSSKGYWDLEIHKDGSANYIEVVTTK